MADLKTKLKNLFINYRQAPAMLWRRGNAHMSYYLSGIKKHCAAPPEAVNIYPTDRCNLKCSMCFERLRKPRAELNLSAWQRILNQIRKFRPRIHLSGGEPLLYPHIIDLIKLIKAYDMYLVITTNGTLLDKYAGDIVGNRVNQLHISIDGPEPVHDRIRGVHGTFKKIMSGLKKIKKLQGTDHLPMIRINSMLNLDNPAAMQEVIKIGCIIDAQSIQFQHPLYVDTQSLASHRFFIKKSLKRDLNYWQNADIPIKKMKDPGAAYNIIRDLEAEKSMNVTVFPKLSMAELKAYYNNAQDFQKIYAGACRAMWNTATILPSGDVESCPDYIIGNCQRSSFLDLWNNKTMKTLRKRIRRRNFFTVCNGCCFFYD
jgi:MoaA/NifB/PqqE/SkfB family radical SAM enzyme